MKKLFITLLLFFFYVAQGAHGAMIIHKTGASAAAFFEADWSTNTPGATDETCVTAGGCPDTWDGMTDASSYCSVSGGNLLCAVTGDSTFFTGIDDDVGEVLEGFSSTEYWFELKVRLSEVSGFDTGLGTSIVRLYGGATAQLTVYLYTDGSGNIDGVRGAGHKDGGTQWCTEQAFSPVADTWYTMRYYWKKDSDGGADTADNGELKFTVVGETTACELSTVDSDTIGALTKLHIGLPTSNFYNATSFNLEFDYFKLYTSDPGWSW